MLQSLFFSTGRLLGAAGLTPATALLGEGSIALALLFSAAVMARVERRSFSDYGIPGRSALGRHFREGVVWGFLAITALLAVMVAAHAFSLGNLALRGPDPLYYGSAWAAGFLAVGLAEELLFRGYALFTLSTAIGFWPAAILLSAAFAGIHLPNAGETWTGLLSAGLIGLFFCFTVRRTGNLWFAVGMHFIWDYSESFIYSVPDSGVTVAGHLLDSSFYGPRWLSGGPAGPEGSVLTFGLMAALFLLFNRRYRDVRFPGLSELAASARNVAVEHINSSHEG
jgi:uncharacterized protein